MITPEIVSCPDHVFTCLGDEAPDFLKVFRAPSGTVTKRGPSLALFCSAKAPAGILLAIHDLAQQWRQGSHVIISGFHSPVEQEAFEILLRGPGQVIYCPARGLPKRFPPAWREALEAGRLTILSPFPDSVRRATKETAIYRNRIVAALADTVLVAYAHPGSSTEQLAQEVLAWGKPIYTINQTTGQRLIDFGVLVWESNYE
ncbi:MAG: DNA-processing protein DprA [Anaerolinea sp.]|nr:DNA-processing protein DprA [Anaerolinea sp.]